MIFFRLVSLALAISRRRFSRFLAIMARRFSSGGDRKHMEKQNNIKKAEAKTTLGASRGSFEIT